jgi:hypothetical protein
MPPPRRQKRVASRGTPRWVSLERMSWTFWRAYSSRLVPADDVSHSWHHGGGRYPADCDQGVRQPLCAAGGASGGAAAERANLDEPVEDAGSAPLERSIG